MRKDQLHNRDHLKQFRKELRSSLTRAESVLWNSLKGQRFKGKKFRRQHSIGDFIADFYCASEKIIIELDGDYHAEPEQAAYDKERDEILRSNGFTVLRFDNKMVFQNLDLLLQTIEYNFNR